MRKIVGLWILGLVLLSPGAFSVYLGHSREAIIAYLVTGVIVVLVFFGVWLIVGKG